MNIKKLLENEYEIIVSNIDEFANILINSYEAGLEVSNMTYQYYRSGRVKILLKDTKGVMELVQDPDSPDFGRVAFNLMIYFKNNDKVITYKKCQELLDMDEEDFEVWRRLQ